MRSLLSHSIITWVVLSFFSQISGIRAEPRLDVDVSTAESRPQRELEGKIIFIHGGHGYTADNLGSGAWSFQRGKTHGMIEDLGNQQQMTHLARYLLRAGATIVPLRPIGQQSHEIILDNTSTEVEWVGNWSDGNESVYFGGAGETPFRQSSTSQTESAFARYRPKIPATGWYPVYAWTPAGDHRASDQLYRIKHAGGTSEITVNHRRVGNGLVYLGTYRFRAGTEGYVDISNRSNDIGRMVVADMIRFGNGMGDIDRGGGVSGRSREDESGLYWVMWHVNRCQGIDESAYRATDKDRDAAVSFSPRYAAFMNQQREGALKDRVFVSFHSNASNGKARGTLGLYNGNNNPRTATPNQFLLAHTLARQVNDEMVSLSDQFKHDWYDRGDNVTLDRTDIEFGEINNLYIHDEFDATIVEVAFHDNQLDAELMRDPKVRDAVARATYHGIVKYFRTLEEDGATSAAQNPGVVKEKGKR